MKKKYIRRLAALVALFGFLGSSYAMAEDTHPTNDKSVAAKAKKEESKAPSGVTKKEKKVKKQDTVPAK